MSSASRERRLVDVAERTVVLEPTRGLTIPRTDLVEVERSIEREWLVTNGIGGFACGTLAGINTRRYHGLLVAALRPPVERTLMVAKLDATVAYRGERHALFSNEFTDGTITPRGFAALASFHLEGSMPVWRWTLGDALIEQRIWMAQGFNTTYVRFSVVRASEPIELEAVPLCSYRDYHAHHRGQRDTLVTRVPNGVQIDAYWGATPYRILADFGSVELAPEWYWNFKHRAEAARGLDDREDLFRPAVLRTRVEAGQHWTVILTSETGKPSDANASLAAERERQHNLLAVAECSNPAFCAWSSPEWLAHLVLAADQFIVTRRAVDADSRTADGSAPGETSSASHTIIAGYPWFTDWGRDTMIALPGLTLSTGRHEIAASVLRTFARHVSEGMLPNRFPDAGEMPEYNTVDATLWYFVAIDEYLRASGDDALVRELYPTLQSIIDWHRRGTRYGIKVDEHDGLLRAGIDGVQLTWMDAKIGDWVITPRTGKAVEINALWFNALCIMKELAQKTGDRVAAREYAVQSAHVQRSFNERFWYDEGGYLYDVIDATQGDDASLRPNQLIAVSLRCDLIDSSRAKQVVDICARELWTPLGVRSLAPAKATGHWPLGAGQNEALPESPWDFSRVFRAKFSAPDVRYAGRYVGGPRERDAVYHQGTAWSWLLGPFALAHYRVYRDARAALSYLEGIETHLFEACIGQVSEISDGDAPFTPRGCFAQAWGVAEILRAWSEIHANER